MTEDFDQKPGEGLPWEEYVALARRRVWHFAIPFFLTWLAVWAVSWFLPAVYRSGTLILVEQPSVPQQYVVSNIAGDLQDRLNSITQHAAMEYCRWLSKKTNKQYRLPTEAEWEWACRAGTTTAYSFGDDPKSLGEYAWIEDNSEEKARKVGLKKPNPWGLYDMHGNVAEWCIDLYKKDFYSTLPKDKISLLPFSPPEDTRYPYVARGGSWIDPPEKCRSAARRFSERSWLKLDPQRPQSIWWMTSADYVGFRVVVAVEEDPRLKGIQSKVNWFSN